MPASSTSALYTPFLDKNQIKMRVRARLDSIGERHLDPVTYLFALADLEPSFPQEVFRELLTEEAEILLATPSGRERARWILDELTSSSEGTPAATKALKLLERHFGGQGEMDFAAEIDRLYDEIREIVETRAGDPELPDLLQPLQSRLESLEEMEADSMERQYRARLEFDPEAGRQLLEKAAHLLGNP